MAGLFWGLFLVPVGPGIQYIDHLYGSGFPHYFWWRKLEIHLQKQGRGEDSKRCGLWWRQFATRSFKWRMLVLFVKRAWIPCHLFRGIAELCCKDTLVWISLNKNIFLRSGASGSWNEEQLYCINLSIPRDLKFDCPIFFLSWLDPLDLVPILFAFFQGRASSWVGLDTKVIIGGADGNSPMFAGPLIGWSCAVDESYWFKSTHDMKRFQHDSCRMLPQQRAGDRCHMWSYMYVHVPQNRFHSSITGDTFHLAKFKCTGLLNRNVEQFDSYQYYPTPRPQDSNLTKGYCWSPCLIFSLLKMDKTYKQHQCQMLMSWFQTFLNLE